MFSQVAFVRAVVDGFASALVEEDAPGGGGASFGRSSSGGNGSRGRLRLREQTVAEAHGFDGVTVISSEFFAESPDDVAERIARALEQQAVAVAQREFPQPQVRFLGEQRGVQRAAPGVVAPLMDGTQDASARAAQVAGRAIGVAAVLAAQHQGLAVAADIGQQAYVGPVAQ